MDREVVIATLLLVALTWLLYKLTVLLQGDNKPPEGASKPNAESDSSVGGSSASRQIPIHQRLRRGVNK